jgi:mRNA interferase MazF
VRRGDIWWASMRSPKGSEPGYRRPVLVVQSNDFNESRIQTVIVAVITSNLRLAAAPGNVFCGKRQTPLARASVVNISQLYTIDKRFLTERIGALSPTLLSEVENGLRLVLSL